MSNTKCGGCGRFLTGGAVCAKCKGMFHNQCVNLTSHVPKKWLCPGCVANTPRRDNTNTPIKSQGEQEIDSSPSPQRPKDEADPQRVLLEEIRALRADMNSFRNDFGSFREEVRKEIKDLRALSQATAERMDGFSERLERQENRLESQEASLETIGKENKDLKIEVALLKRELRERDQLALQNDLEISGVTESNGESVFQIVSLLAMKLGVKVDERDIVDARRVGPVRVGQDGKRQTRPIVLRVGRRAVRDQVLSAARSRRGLTTADIEVAGAPRPIYINERLSKERRLLFTKARALCKQHNWKYAWTREGNVLVRQADGKAAFRIRDEEEFNGIFKQ